MEVTEKKPQIPTWKMWLTVIMIVMALTAIQNYQIHYRMQQEILNLESMLSQVLQLQIEYQQDLIQILERLP